MEFRQNADVEVLKLHVPSNTKRANFTHFTVYTRSVLVEQNLGAFENAGRFGGLIFGWILSLDIGKLESWKKTLGETASTCGHCLIDYVEMPLDSNVLKEILCWGSMLKFWRDFRIRFEFKNPALRPQPNLLKVICCFMVLASCFSLWHMFLEDQLCSLDPFVGMCAQFWEHPHVPRYKPFFFQMLVGLVTSSSKTSVSKSTWRRFFLPDRLTNQVILTCWFHRSLRPPLLFAVLQ